MIKTKSLIPAILLFFTSWVIFIQPIYFGLNYWTYGLFAAMMTAISFYCAFYRRKIFPAILFFTIVHVSVPLNIAFVRAIGINFPGSYYLIPIVLFSLLIILFRSLRENISWWKKERIDRISLFIILGLSVISGLALYMWGYYVAGDTNLRLFLDELPDVPFVWIIINGFGFAVLNSVAEEYLSRGMLWEGLRGMADNPYWIIPMQALIFGLFHIKGFPGGLIGVIMVIFWSLVLGIIRYRTKGLLGVFIGHFFADFTIYLILYSMK